MELTCITVDDSAVQRMLVSRLATAHVKLNLVGEFSNAVEARNFLSTNKIDLIFLDVEMPSVNGFDLLDNLQTFPQVIFITSKSEYALKAFDYNATDYLQKPVTNARFNAAIKRALALHRLRNISENVDDNFIVIKSNLKNLKVNITKIKWIEAFGDYVRIITDTEGHLVLSTMTNFESYINNPKFIRVHKSYIINIDKINKYSAKFAEIGTQKIPISRAKKDLLDAAIKNI